MNKLKVFTAFSGYDSQCLALNRLKEVHPDFEYELVGWSEIDRYAIQAHNALFPQWADRNYGDISKINWCMVPKCDLFTYSFPCQDISNAGLQRGFEEGSGTRSGLLWECEKAIEAMTPKYLLLENVKALTSKKFMPEFEKWLEKLESYGYTNYWQVLNAKDYGVPQNRERVFVVSILDGCTLLYRFPEPFHLNLRLKDILESNVDEKYYISSKMVKYITDNNDKWAGNNKNSLINRSVALAINTAEGSRRCDASNYICNSLGDDVDLKKLISEESKEPETSVQKDNYIKEPSIIRVGELDEDGWHRHAKEVLSIDGVSTCISTQSNNLLQKIAEPTSNTITPVQKDNYSTAPLSMEYKIRKLTERECFRLMGVRDDEIDIIKSSGLSKTQQYKMAGNSIVVDVLYYVFNSLFYDDPNINAGKANNDSIPLTRIGNIYGPNKGTSYAGNVWEKNGVSPTLTAMGGGMRQPLIISEKLLDTKYESDGRVFDTDGIGPTLRSTGHMPLIKESAERKHKDTNKKKYHLRFKLNITI